jgi:hypothetical protein
LFFAITKIGIGHAFGETFLDSFETRPVHLRPEKMLLRVGAAFQAWLRGSGKSPWGSMVTESLNGTMLQGTSVCSESRLYDKLPVG